MKNEENAYFTVEATLVLVMVLGIIILLIYLVFFQYNRCLMEQDMGALALKGCSLEEGEKEQLLQELEQYAATIYWDKYIPWEREKIEIELSGNRVSVSGGGMLHFPFAALMGKGVENGWSMKIKYENQRIEPVSFIRTYRKITGGE